MKILWHILVPVAFMTWNFSACGVTINHQINLPGEPLTPQDFENAKIFPSRDKSNEETENCEIFGKELQKSTYQSNFQIWEDGYIPYALDIKFDILERAEIAKAITKLRQLTCIKFITKLFHKDYVFFAKRSGYCGSFIGRQGGEQIVTLNKGCMFEGNILHELLHVVGFEHEQCRIDRDDYIRVSFNNITESAKHNFFKVTPPRPNYAGQYDLLSITHYSAFAFAKHNKLQTLFPFDKVKGEKMGQREELSELDRFKINSYYNCSTKITTMPENSKNSVPSNTHMDFYPMCPEFFKIGKCECKKSKVWMKINCRYSCRKILPYVECGNYNSQCDMWAEVGHCKDPQNQDYMKIYCSKACEACQT